MRVMHSGRVTKLEFGLHSALESKHKNKNPQSTIAGETAYGGKVGIYICAALIKVLKKTVQWRLNILSKVSFQSKWSCSSD